MNKLTTMIPGAYIVNLVKVMVPQIHIHFRALVAPVLLRINQSVAIKTASHEDKKEEREGRLHYEES